MEMKFNLKKDLKKKAKRNKFLNVQLRVFQFKFAVVFLWLLITFMSNTCYFNTHGLEKTYRVEGKEK